MPVYNGETFIREALDSLLAQSFIDYELIISDNASTDNTEIICREYAAKDHRIRYVRQLENRGATENFRLLIDEAAAKYFMWAAADDKAAPNFIKEVFDVINRDETIILVMTDVQNISSDGALLEISRIENIRKKDVVADWPKVRRLFFENPTSNVFFCIYGLYRTKDMKLAQLNYKDKVKYAASSEVPWLAQISLLGKIVAIPYALKFYRRHYESIYHVEAKNFTVAKEIHNKINVSIILLDILIHSNLSLTEKILTCKTIVFTFLRFIVVAVVRAAVRRIKDKMSNG